MNYYNGCKKIDIQEVNRLVEMLRLLAEEHWIPDQAIPHLCSGESEGVRDVLLNALLGATNNLLPLESVFVEDNDYKKSKDGVLELLTSDLSLPQSSGLEGRDPESIIITEGGGDFYRTLVSVRVDKFATDRLGIVIGVDRNSLIHQCLTLADWSYFRRFPWTLPEMWRGKEIYFWKSAVRTEDFISPSSGERAFMCWVPHAIFSKDRFEFGWRLFDPWEEVEE